MLNQEAGLHRPDTYHCTLKCQNGPSLFHPTSFAIYLSPFMYLQLKKSSSNKHDHEFKLQTPGIYCPHKNVSHYIRQTRNPGLEVLRAVFGGHAVA
jgi:hypothetical protein